MTATHPHHFPLSNILLIIIIVIMLALLVLQVWHMLDNNRPVIRPHSAPTKPPQLPGAWYEKFKDPEVMERERIAT